MKDPEKIKMFLNIGDQRLSRIVEVANQEFTRQVEREVDALYREWRISFPSRSDNEIMAMVAFQYASFYAELKRRYEEATQEALSCLDAATRTEQVRFAPEEPEN